MVLVAGGGGVLTSIYQHFNVLIALLVYLTVIETPNPPSIVELPPEEPLTPHHNHEL